MRSRPAYLLLLAVLTLVGCTAPVLMPENGVEELAALNRAAAALPARTTRVCINDDRRPCRLAVHESGDGHADRVIVMLHGVLSDSAVWRFMRPELASSCDVIAIDLPGCGGSDRPDPSVVGLAAYAPPALARDALATVRARLAARGKDDDAPITVVAHSLGGMIALRMFADARIRADYADVLDRVDGLVLFTPVDVAVEKDIPSFRAIAEISDVEMAIADLSGLLRAKVAAGTRDGVVDPRYATREEARRVLDLLRDRSRRRAAQAMIRQAIPTRSNRPYWDQIEPIVQAYKNIDVPCLIVWGARDELFPVSMGFKLQYHLPHARLHVVSYGMHCLPVERPRLCTQLVRDFIVNGMEERPVVAWGNEAAAFESAARLAAAEMVKRP